MAKNTDFAGDGGTLQITRLRRDRAMAYSKRRAVPFSSGVLILGLGIQNVVANGWVSSPEFNPFLFKGSASPGMDSWFKDAKLGMFMHWGPVSQWGTEISFPLVCKGFPCHPKGPNNTNTNITTTEELKAHREAYTKLATTFNPMDFDADNMAKLAKAAGFKCDYPSPHLDFCM